MNTIFIIVIVVLAIFAAYDFFFRNAPEMPEELGRIDEELRRRGQ